ncbi:MAG: NAD-binding protein [Patescibacteria group bacterium]|nr:NAD-binding protein [Patescibacteria group bacterium]
MKTVIIGLGEVGKALYEILSEHYKTVGFDKNDWHANFDYDGEENCETEVMHVCIPYFDNFVEIVGQYQQKFQPKITIIHSTVPVGISRRCGAVHSPIRGIHPNLEGGIRTFVKFLGGEQASEVADYFRRAGLKVHLCDEPETTELMKLMDTEYYRVCIEFAQRVKNLCRMYEVPFSDAYRLSNLTYNEGYTKLGHPEFVRPVLEPIMKEIGGHCVLPNKRILEGMAAKMQGNCHA